MDVILLSAIILLAFIAYEVYSGQVPLRWLGSIKRDERPFFYWLSILFHLAVMGVVVYAWIDGLRIPFGEFWDGLFD